MKNYRICQIKKHKIGLLKKRVGVEPLETRKVKTGETYKRRIGRKEVGTKDVYWYGLNGDGSSNYFGEAYTRPVPIYEDIYEDIPRYREEYLYSEEPKPQLIRKSSTKRYITTLDNRPHVKVPQQYKEGLATILNGLTYYKFDGYSPEQVQLAIAFIIGKQQPKIQDVYYEPDEPPVLNTVTEESINLKPSAEEVVAKILGDTEKPADKEPTNKKPEQKSIVRPIETEEVEADSTNKGVFMYKYPRREVHTYNIQPEIAELVKDLLKNYTPAESRNSEQKYIYTDKPLYNLPEGFATDSVFHLIYKKDPNRDRDTDPLDSNYITSDIIDYLYDSRFDELLSLGLYRPDNNRVVWSDKYTNSEIPVSNTENLVFIPADYSYNIDYPNIYKKYLNVIDYDNKGNPIIDISQAPTLLVLLSSKYIWHKPLEQIDIKTYPYNETARKLRELAITNSSNNTDTLKQKAKNFIGNLLNIF